MIPEIIILMNFYNFDVIKFRGIGTGVDKWARTRAENSGTGLHIYRNLLCA
jgi:hypothetical protein